MIKPQIVKLKYESSEEIKKVPFFEIIICSILYFIIAFINIFKRYPNYISNILRYIILVLVAIPIMISVLIQKRELSDLISHWNLPVNPLTKGSKEPNSPSSPIKEFFMITIALFIIKLSLIFSYINENCKEKNLPCNLFEDKISNSIKIASKSIFLTTVSFILINVILSFFGIYILGYLKKNVIFYSLLCGGFYHIGSLLYINSQFQVYKNEK